MNFIGVLSISVHNKQHFSSGEGALVVANHPTLVDVVIIISQLRQCDCIVKASLWKNPFTRHVIQMAGYIRNDHPMILEICGKKIASGRKLLVFPEGTRTEPNQKIKCQRGAAQLALRCQATIQRVLITSRPAALYKGIAWYQVPERQPKIDVHVLPPESIEHILDQSRSVPIAARKLTKYFDSALEPSKAFALNNIEDYAVEHFRKQN
ncbi:lysophospholipid acyltransferase family protein [Vibrio taketomensis]|uniref:lysophospholipid acyltransferase family protein n=1 Tax=Vibrio taketomensis TaxID=2572923 RepID=UPI001389B178|nr:lysophospholipid acyltransferase family protein [Vibrio taketomensis]